LTIRAGPAKMAAMSSRSPQVRIIV